jgi:RND superfamily putative drug exporter
MRAPLASAAASVAVLVALAIPVLDFETGFSGIRTLPDRFPSKQGFLVLEESFGVGTVDSVEVVVEGDVRSDVLRAALDRIAASLRTNPAFADPELTVAEDGEAARLEALVVGDSRDARAVAAVEQLRRQTVPDAIGSADAVALVTGETPSRSTIDSRPWLPIVFAFVLALSRAAACVRTIACRSWHHAQPALGRSGLRPLTPRLRRGHR